MNTIRQRLFTNWHFMRFARFGFGVLMLILAIRTRDLSSLPFSIFFLFTAITGIWCCDTEGRYVSHTNGTEKDTVSTDYRAAKSAAPNH